jgi:hypothetical protein
MSSVPLNAPAKSNLGSSLLVLFSQTLKSNYRNTNKTLKLVTVVDFVYRQWLEDKIISY